MGKYSLKVRNASLEKPIDEEPALLASSPTPINTEAQSSELFQKCTEIRNSKDKNIEKYLESKGMICFSTSLIVFSLFGDDFNTLGFSKSADNYFSSLFVVCLAYFSVELTILFVLKIGYRWSFYFWLDFIATVSLITDITWIWESIIGVSTSNGGSNSKNLQNAGSASRASTKTSRVIRIIRLIRLIRLIKIYKNAKAVLKSSDKDEISETNPNLDPQTKLGKTVGEMTMQRVILLVLVVLLIVPFFDYDFYNTSQTSWDFGLKEMVSFKNIDGFEAVKDNYINYHSSEIRPIIYLSWVNQSGNYEWYGATNYNDLRYDEIYYSSQDTDISIFDIRYDARLSSLLNIMKTLFVCVVLTLGAIYFAKDSEDLVVKPIEKILLSVKLIAKNPIAASDLKVNTNEHGPTYIKTCCETGIKSESGYEIKVIEFTIIKIGILLALGFGEAGSSIIGQNIEKSGEVDPIIKGAKIVGIFGFCDIRNFTDTTEELQEGVMVFVNEIAQVVHGVVDKYMGCANKNIGDAFLLVWKFEPEEFYIDEDSIMRNSDSPKAFYIPDLALMSFLKILAKVNKDPVMLKYRNYPKLTQRMPNYEVKMGFGLHIGWAIEGAIGSEFKVDASYLSPHVNIASALEGSTKAYGVSLLLSGDLYGYLSPEIKNYCRKIDCIYIKGSIKPIEIYTSDCDFSSFLPSPNKIKNKDFFRKKKINLLKGLQDNLITTIALFSSSNEIALMRKDFTLEFFSEFGKGIEYYIQGDWTSAKTFIEKALEIRQKDGPCMAILSYMREYDFLSPKDWKNARYLG